MVNSSTVTVSKNILGTETIQAPPGHSWKAEKRRNNYGYFQPIGVLTTTSPADKHDLDIFDRLSLVSLPAVKLFVEMKKRRNLKNSLLVYAPNHGNTSKRVVFNRQVRLLKQQELIKKVPVSNPHVKVRKHTYMINPKLIKCMDYDDAISLWHQLK